MLTAYIDNSLNIIVTMLTSVVCASAGPTAGDVLTNPLPIHHTLAVFKPATQKHNGKQVESPTARNIILHVSKPATVWVVVDVGGRGDVRDDSAEIRFQTFLRKNIVSSSSMGEDVHSLTLSIQHFLRRPPRHSLSKGQ